MMLINFYLSFCQFQPGVAYKSVTYKKSVLCYVMWNLSTVGSLQFCNDSAIASLMESDQNRPCNEQ